jgi:hypothetical protein
LQAKFKHLALLDHCVEVNSKDVWLDRSKADVNRRSNLTPYRRPILTPLSGGFWR